MGELSFLTIIVSLAVCSLLVYGIFQYMKVRLTVLEQSHREQAMILQQYIEESSTDIHRLYQISTTRYNGPDKAQPFQQPGSIILEYANDIINEQQTTNEKPVAYNERHTIHLDTALFLNKRNNNLIEISSDSENTTDTGSDSGSDSGSDTGSDSSSNSDNDGSDSTDSENESGSDNSSIAIESETVFNVNDIHDEKVTLVNEESHSSEVKTVTVDLGTLQEPVVVPKHPETNVLSMLYKQAQLTPLPDDSDLDADPSTNVVEVQDITLLSITAMNDIVSDTTHVKQDTTTSSVNPTVSVSSNTQTTTSSAPVHVPLSAMSVPDLKQLLKELCKNQPERHAEIQKLKKPELIYAIKQLQQ
jgi:hypothetical protein